MLQPSALHYIARNFLIIGIQVVCVKNKTTNRGLSALLQRTFYFFSIACRVVWLLRVAPTSARSAWKPTALVCGSSENIISEFYWSRDSKFRNPQFINQWEFKTFWHSPPKNSSDSKPRCQAWLQYCTWSISSSSGSSDQWKLTTILWTNNNTNHYIQPITCNTLPPINSLQIIFAHPGGPFSLLTKIYPRGVFSQDCDNSLLF